MTIEEDSVSISKINRRQVQEAFEDRQLVDNPPKLFDRPLSRKVRDRHIRLAEKRARKKKV